jgi:pilus assembly protein CpaF
MIVAKTQTRVDAKQAFQQLKTRLHRQMVDAIDLSKAGELSEHELRDQLRALAAHLCTRDGVQLDPGDRDEMVKEIMDEIYGFGPLEPLMADPEISDVLVNGADSVFVERNGLLEPTDVRFANDGHLLQFIQKLVGRAGRRIDEVSPMVDAKLPDGSRLNAVIPPLALRGPTLSIRRFTRKVLQFEDMVRLGTLAPEMADFLGLIVRCRLNVLISGGTGAGKTTLLNNLSRFIPVSERVITIEQTAELQLQQPDIVAMEMRPANIEGRGEITQRDLLKNSLRMRPDRIIVGEARGGEVLEMLQAMNTGHDGSMSTVHANETRDALDRLEMMIALSGVELPTLVARQYIAAALQILVHITRLSSGERKVVRISELCGCQDGVYTIKDIFAYRLAGLDSSGRSQGSFYATGYEPLALKRLAAAGFEAPANLFTPRELTAYDENGEFGIRSPQSKIRNPKSKTRVLNNHGNHRPDDRSNPSSPRVCRHSAHRREIRHR